jgi:phage terminase large subunit GpA-like protein
MPTAEQVERAFWRGLRPDPLLTVSEWADQRRILSSKASHEHGPWRTSRTPYLRKPMDNLSATSKTQEVVLVFGAQMGKSEMLNNWMGYAMDIQPAPTLFVQPTIDMAKRYSKMRIAPMIEATPSLQEKVKAPRERDSGNTMLMKEFAGGFLILGGANAASGLASMPIRNLAGDEIDRWPSDVDEEGSPLVIVEARTRTFGVRAKKAWTSTPTIAGRSAIWARWETSNQQMLKLPCPHCGHRQVISWDRMHYDPKDPGLPNTLRTPPVLICEECGTGIEEDAKAWWYDPDVFDDDWWEAAYPERTVQGYHCSALYSPLGWFSWTEAAVGYEKAKDNPADLKPWTNTVLAECWNDDGEAPDWEALYNRREGYELGTVPASVVFITCGVDVQKDRLELEVVGWGPGMESWSLDYQILAGDTAEPAVWRELSKFVRSEFGRGDGQRLPIRMTAIDSGFRTEEVKRWVRKQAGNRVIAIKGVESQVSVIGTPSRVEVLRNGKALRGGVKIWPVGTSTAKSELYGWLRRPLPEEEGEGLPHGWCHFPMHGEEYFRQLCAERLTNTIDRRGYTKFEWIKTRPRNEALDCRVYARAAAALVGADRWSDERWKEERMNGMERTELPAAPAVQAQDDAPLAVEKRRSSFWD